MNISETNQGSRVYLHAKAFKLYKIIAITLAIITAASITVSFFTRNSADSRYLSKSPFISVFYILLGVCVLFSVSALFIFKKRSISIIPSTNPILKYANLLPAIGVLPCIVFNFSELSNNVSNTLLIFTALTSVGHAAYYLCRSTPTPTAAKLISGYIQIIFCALTIAQLYMDFSAEMNSPLKLLIEFSLVLLMLNTVTDLRIAIGIPNVSQFIFTKALYLSLSLSTFALSISSFASNIDLYENALYLIYPIMLFTAAIPSLLDFLSATLTYTPTTDQEKIEQYI